MVGGPGAEGIVISVLGAPRIECDGRTVQTEVWRLSEWVDQTTGPSRNVLGTVGRDNVEVAPGRAARTSP